MWQRRQIYHQTNPSVDGSRYSPQRLEKAEILINCTTRTVGSFKMLFYCEICSLQIKLVGTQSLHKMKKSFQLINLFFWVNLSSLSDLSPAELRSQFIICFDVCDDWHRWSSLVSAKLMNFGENCSIKSYLCHPLMLCSTCQVRLIESQNKVAYLGNGLVDSQNGFNMEFGISFRNGQPS